MPCSDCSRWHDSTGVDGFCGLVDVDGYADRPSAVAGGYPSTRTAFFGAMAVHRQEETGEWLVDDYGDEYQDIETVSKYRRGMITHASHSCSMHSPR